MSTVRCVISNESKQRIVVATKAFTNDVSILPTIESPSPLRIAHPSGEIWFACFFETLLIEPGEKKVTTGFGGSIVVLPNSIIIFDNASNERERAKKHPDSNFYPITISISNKLITYMEITYV